MTEEENLLNKVAEFLNVIDSCPRFEMGAGGMTIDAQLRRTIINRVPAFPVEELRDAYYSYLESTFDDNQPKKGDL